MINNLHWDTLEKRRQLSCLILMYRIHTQQIPINGDRYLAPMLLNSTRYYHPTKYEIIPARIQVYTSSFFPRTVIWCNALPANVLVAPTFEAFRGAVTTVTNLSCDLVFTRTLFILYFHLIYTFTRTFTFNTAHVYIHPLAFKS